MLHLLLTLLPVVLMIALLGWVANRGWQEKDGEARPTLREELREVRSAGAGRLRRMRESTQVHPDPNVEAQRQGSWG